MIDQFFLLQNMLENILPLSSLSFTIFFLKFMYDLTVITIYKFCFFLMNQILNYLEIWFYRGFTINEFNSIQGFYKLS